MSRLTVLTAAASLLLSGCAYHRLTVADPNPGSPWIGVDSNAAGFGAIERRTVAECPTNLLDQVRVRQTFAQSLATVLTLGLWMPTRIEYRCAKAPTAEGSTEGSTGG
jgi:hypothetical protein